MPYLPEDQTRHQQALAKFAEWSLDAELLIALKNLRELMLNQSYAEYEEQIRDFFEKNLKLAYVIQSNNFPQHSQTHLTALINQYIKVIATQKPELKITECVKLEKEADKFSNEVGGRLFLRKIAAVALAVAGAAVILAGIAALIAVPYLAVAAIGLQSASIPLMMLYVFNLGCVALLCTFPGLLGILGGAPLVNQASKMLESPRFQVPTVANAATSLAKNTMRLFKQQNNAPVKPDSNAQAVRTASIGFNRQKN